jgi:hypothetical protein
MFCLAQDVIPERRPECAGREAVCVLLVERPAIFVWRERASIAVPQADRPPTIPITLRSDSLLQLASGTHVVEMSCVEGDFVVPGRAVRNPRLRRPIAYLGGLSLPMLLDHVKSPRTPCSLLSTWAKLAGSIKAAELLEAVLRLELIVPVGQHSHEQLR